MEVLIPELWGGPKRCISDKLPGDTSAVGLKNKSVEISMGRSVSLFPGGFCSGPAALHMMFPLLQCLPRKTVPHSCSCLGSVCSLKSSLNPLAPGRPRGDDTLIVL